MTVHGLKTLCPAYSYPGKSSSQLSLNYQVHDTQNCTFFLTPAAGLVTHMEAVTATVRVSKGLFTDILLT